MVAANPQRTSWTDEEVCGNLAVEWYRPIEAYIPQNVQIIASNGLLYVSTARGLYALDAVSGATVWRYDTELPLGNSPTVSDGVVYVGGYDKKLHALDAVTGYPLWEFSQAEAGYDSNPLVVDGKVIVGNRDGGLYAIGAHGTGQQGQLLWRFDTAGPVHQSPAYENGVVYFASDDQYGYAVDANSGALLWRSQKLPGDGYHSYWPVVFGDYVIFSAASAYRPDRDPGTRTLKDDNGAPIGKLLDVQKVDLFPNEPVGTLMGPVSNPEAWSNGYDVMDMSRITEYLEANPNADSHNGKPWRRLYVLLNKNNGSEYSFDSDHDGYAEYFPVIHWGTKSGNHYPPIIGADGLIYVSNQFRHTYGKVMGWEFGTQNMSQLAGQGDPPEPQAISAGGNYIYRNLCCDRIGSIFPIVNNVNEYNIFSYNLESLAPDYDDMWYITDSAMSRHQGWYMGAVDWYGTANDGINTVNGIYHNHGDQNPLIPYNGRIYTHRSNTIFAFGTSQALGKQPLLAISNAQDSVNVPSTGELVTRLAEEVEKILSVYENEGKFLRPGYINTRVGNYTNSLHDYFENPGDTLLTLALAYPHLPAQQTRIANYLNAFYQQYFSQGPISDIGWLDGAPREAMELPDDILDSLNDPSNSGLYGSKLGSQLFISASYPPINLYALYKYAALVPGVNVSAVYEMAKDLLVVPSGVPSDMFRLYPYEHNGWISGYIGFLALQDLAGMSGVDSQLRQQVIAERDNLISQRYNLFDKDDTWWTENENYYKKVFSIGRNFLFMVPELGAYYRDNTAGSGYMLNRVEEALSEYDYVTPYWFVSLFESTLGESTVHHLHDSPALFQARAWILQEPRSELYKYLDVPAFERGDLYYIQNLITTIEAP